MIDATLFGDPESVRMLLKKGANPTIKDDEGHTALDYANEENRIEAKQILEEEQKSKQ